MESGKNCENFMHEIEKYGNWYHVSHQFSVLDKKSADFNERFHFDLLLTVIWLLIDDHVIMILHTDDHVNNVFSRNVILCDAIIMSTVN